MGVEQVGDDWTRLGAEDPLWAVLIRPGTQGRRWDENEFLQTGRDEVEAVLEQLLELGVLPKLDRVLDFGSGAGRASQALAEHAPAVVGVDISPSMIEVAERLDRSGGRCQFVLNQGPDLSMFADDSFDLVYSSLVLQHVPADAARAYLAEMGRVLRPGGAMAVQVAARPTMSVKGLLFKYAPSRLLRWGQVRLLHYPAPMLMAAMSDEEFRAAVAPRVEILRTIADETYGGHWVYHRHFAVKRR